MIESKIEIIMLSDGTYTRHDISSIPIDEFDFSQLGLSNYLIKNRINTNDMNKIVFEKKTWIIDEDGSTITTDRTEIGKTESIKEAIKRGNIRVSKTKMQKLFSQSELEEMGYDTI